ncbi:MAG: STAS domain-containing protein [Dehalococcoidales bacterium]|nr:STAS domain-containing protein [Dehalococcoidales bacterium]
MEIEVKKAGNIDILYLTGRLDAYAANDVEKKINMVTDKNSVNLVVCMEKLEYISSSGLRVLLAALKKARKQQGDIRLSCLQPYVKEVFDVAGFSQLFKMFEKEDEAVTSYSDNDKQ